MRATLLIGAIIAALSFAPSARAADPQPYKVEIASSGNKAMDAMLKASADLVSLRKSAPVSPYGLIARARSEVDRLKTVLESFGYYQGVPSIQINGMALNNPHLADTLVALSNKADARVTIGFTLGPLYHLGTVNVDGDLPASAAKALQLKSGAPAVAANVLAAGARVLATLGDQGYAFAKVDAPVAYEDEKAPLLDVTFHVTPGPRVNIGKIEFQGLKRVHDAAVRRRLLLHSGQQYSSTQVDRARADLLTMGVFAAVSVQAGSKIDETGGVPITFQFRERKRHNVSLSAAYSSDLGGSATATWTDRNLFGNAEQLTLSASLINAGGSASTGVGYDTKAVFTKPDFLRRDQSLQVSVEAVRQFLQAYDQTAVLAGVTLSRKLSKLWTVSVGVSTTSEKIYQELQTHYYTLVGLPLNASYDATGLTSPLDDPLHGIRASVSVTPTESLASGRNAAVTSAEVTQNRDSTFIITVIKVSGYFDLQHIFDIAPGRSVLAARALAGIAQGAGALSLPPDQRFYGGGSNTIRGFEYQGVGPRFTDGTPEGGTAINAGSVEYRQRFGEHYGAAFFIDGGQVSEKLDLLPHHFLIGVGAGVRYYTPIGPIRLDFAVPTKIYGPDEDKFEIYIGLGPAF